MYRKAFACLLIFSVFTLSFAFAEGGSVEIKTEPSLKVFLDAVAIGETDATGNLLLKDVPVGKHIVRIVKPGHITAHIEVDVAEGKTSTLSVTKFYPFPTPQIIPRLPDDIVLVEGSGTIEITTVPLKCSISCDDLGIKETAKTEKFFFLPDIPEGTYSFSFFYKNIKLERGIEVGGKSRTIVSVNFRTSKITAFLSSSDSPPLTAARFDSTLRESLDCVTKQSEEAMENGLEWLAKTQEPDGKWDCTKWGGYGPYTPGVTGLALLAFLGAGNSIKIGRYSNNVAKAVKWLREHQAPNGSFAPKETMYNHAIPTLALMELYLLEPTPDLKGVIGKAYSYMLQAQNKGAAWRYWPQDNDNDTSVTCWCSDVLKAAKLCSLDVEQSACEGVLSFINSVTDMKTGGTGYTSLPIKGQAENEYQKYSMAACGLIIRLNIEDSGRNALCEKVTDILAENKPEWNQPGIGAPFFYYWYHGSKAAYPYRKRFPAMDTWCDRAVKLLVKHQITAIGELKGSWDQPTAHNFGQVGGRVYSTAMATLILQNPYRSLIPTQ